MLSSRQVEAVVDALDAIAKKKAAVSGAKDTAAACADENDKVVKLRWLQQQAKFGRLNGVCGPHTW
jgi:hypothetical protein